MLRNALAVLLVLASCALLLIAVFFAPVGLLGGFDLLQYMSAIRLIVAGHNPYDHVQLFHVQSLLLGEMVEGIAMWNPPLITLFLLPFFPFSFQFSLGLIYLFTLGTVLLCFCLFFLNSGRNCPHRRRAFVLSGLFLVTFYPPVSAMGFGQISFVLLLSTTGFLWFSGILSGKEYRDNFMAGVCLSATLIKPHILFLLYAFLVAHGFKCRQLRALAGMVVGAVILAGVPLIFNPEIYQQYFAAARTPPINFKTPTLGSWLQEFTRIHSVYIRGLPSLLVLVAFVAMFFRNSPGYTRLILLILPLSVVASPYGWVFDQMILLPVGLFLMVHGARQKDWLIPILLLSGNAVMFIIPGELGQHMFVWWPALLSLLVFYSFFLKEDSSKIQINPMAVSAPR